LFAQIIIHNLKPMIDCALNRRWTTGNNFQQADNVLS